MDYVLMLNPDGSQQCCMPSNEFFMKADLKELKQIESHAAEEFVINDEEAMKNKGILKTEGNEKKNPSYQLLFKYFGLASKVFLGPCSFFIVILLHILINVATSSLSFYLAIKLSAFAEGGQSATDLSSSLVIIMGACLLATIIGKVISSMIFMSINRNIHSLVVERLIKTKMQFFDENTAGVILNRMSSDVSVND